MHSACIIKLGGSIITDKKGGRPVFLSGRVRRLAAELATVQRARPSRPFIILYGGGSFGHPLAHRYALVDQPLSAAAFAGIGHTISAMRELGTRLARELLAAGIPIVPLQTSSFARMSSGRVRFTNRSILDTILENKGVPLLGGDVVFTEGDRCTIASADALAVALAREYGGDLFFASDVDGVYKTFPPRGERPLASLTRAELKHFLNTKEATAANKTDVTGAMMGKLRALLPLRGVRVTIFNGVQPNAIAHALIKQGWAAGTRIQL